MKGIGFALVICVCTINLFAQEDEVDRFSFSISWTPAYWGPNDGEFRLDAILPMNFESLIHYKPFKKLSFSTGLGYQRNVMKGLSWASSSTIDLDKSYEWIFNEFRVPVQAYYHFSESISNFDIYLKAAFINEFTFSKMTHYEYDIVSSTRSIRYYSNSLDLGIGSIFRANKSVGIIIEGSLGTVLDKDVLFKMYIFKMKLGVVFK